VKEVTISEFKAKCLALLGQLQKTKTPMGVTRFGKPIAEAVPLSPASAPHGIGSMKAASKSWATLFLPPPTGLGGRRRRAPRPALHFPVPRFPGIDGAWRFVIICIQHRKGGGRMTSSDGSSWDVHRPGEVAET
jgi:hypothetical protein